MSSYRPIIFSNALAAALHQGRKTQTRRLADRQRRAETRQSAWSRALPGERLWVKEQWTRKLPQLGPGYLYGSDPLFEGFQGDMPRQWKPARFMPRDACRAILELTAVRVEPLHAITDADAAAEGIQPGELGFGVPGLPGTWQPTPREAFAALWDSIHDQHDWQSNPEVVVLSFRVLPPEAA